MNSRVLAKEICLEGQSNIMVEFEQLIIDAGVDSSWENPINGYGQFETT